MKLVTVILGLLLASAACGDSPVQHSPELPWTQTTWFGYITMAASPATLELRDGFAMINMTEGGGIIVELGVMRENSADATWYDGDIAYRFHLQFRYLHEVILEGHFTFIKEGILIEPLKHRFVLTHKEFF